MAKASPTAKPFTAWIEQIAIARRPSSRSSQDTCEPSPGTRPNACTSNTPPSDSLARLSSSISRTIAREACSSRQRTGELSTEAKSSGSSARSGSGARTDAICRTWEYTETPSLRRKALHSPPPATRAAVSRAEARSRMLRTSLCLNFCVPTRSACPGRGRWTSSMRSAAGHGDMRSRQFS